MQRISSGVFCCLLPSDETPPSPTEVMFFWRQFWGLLMEQYQKQLVCCSLACWAVGLRSQGSVHRMLVILERAARLTPKMLVIAHASQSLASWQTKPGWSSFLWSFSFLEAAMDIWSQVLVLICFITDKSPWLNGHLKDSYYTCYFSLL